MESSFTTERLSGTVTGVYGTHIFVESRDHAFYARREELAFSDPCLGLKVSFQPGKKPTPASMRNALAVRKA